LCQARYAKAALVGLKVAFAQLWCAKATFSHLSATKDGSSSTDGDGGLRARVVSSGMGLLGRFERDDYLPEFGTLMIRDTWGSSDRTEPPPGTALLNEHATDAQPCGTITRAGNGWLEAGAGDGDRRVRLESHDTPPDPAGDWDDLVETPFRSSTGEICLTQVTGGATEPDLRLSGPGLHRVRVARRGADWLIQFWPVPEPAEPPRWLARRDPVAWPADPGWGHLLGYEVRDLTTVVSAAGNGNGATVTEIAEWGTRHSRAEGWLDDPAWPSPPAPLPSGHPDVDVAAAAQHRNSLAQQAKQQAQRDAIAAQLGVPAPRTRRELLSLLLATGTLIDESGRLRVARTRRTPWTC
jgi:hypothetical protein